jgi:hypothetical protein
MKRSGTGRVLAVLFLGVFSGVYLHSKEIRWLERGRDAFLAEQGHRFDRIVGFHSSAGMLVAGILMAAVAAGLYELIAAGITSVLPASTVEE